MTAVAASAASLTGLLFVALSVAKRADPEAGPAVIQQVRAAAALLAFLNALAVSLFGLVPGTRVGYPAVVMGISGMFFTAAAMRSIFTSPVTRALQRRQAVLIVLLLGIFGTELVSGIVLLADPGGSTPVEIISYALVTSVIVGIARAWELVGDRDTGIVASIAVLTRHVPPPLDREPAASAAEVPGADIPGAVIPRAGGPPAGAPGVPDETGQSG